MRRGRLKRFFAFVTRDAEPEPGTDLFGLRPFPVLYTATTAVLEMLSAIAALVGMVLGLWLLAVVGWAGLVGVMVWGALAARRR